ncbi:MAG: hypothetical protein ACOY5B_07950 [Spirochaetota bacterium]
MREPVRRILTAPLYALAAIVVLLEDWLWEDLQRLAQYIGRLPVFRQAEAMVVALPPWGALAIFALPSVLLVPVKLAALWFISSGHLMAGVVVMVAAKIAGTALVARLFRLTKPKLLTFRLFAKLYEILTAFKARVYETIRASWVYRNIRAWAQAIRQRWQQWRAAHPRWLGRRWTALRKHHRSRRDSLPPR